MRYLGFYARNITNNTLMNDCVGKNNKQSEVKLNKYRALQNTFFYNDYGMLISRQNSMSLLHSFVDRKDYI